MNTNLHLELLKTISVSNITLLKDTAKHINIDKRGKFKYSYFPNFEFGDVTHFINKLDENSLYTIIPLISIFGRDEDPHIILSRQILISKYSKTELIYEFLLKQLDIAINDFEIELDKFHYLIFKYKKIDILI